MSTPTLHAAPEPSTIDPHVPHVQLGQHSYAVYAQRIGYLENKLGRTLDRLIGSSVSDGAGIVSMLGEQVHGVLGVFLPRLMPLHEFRGYVTAEALAAGEYDAAADTSPTVPEIRSAFETVLRVNGFDLLQGLGKLVDTDLLKAAASSAVANQLTSGVSSPTDSSASTAASE
ncbi:hypothetical protein [Mycobacterium sp.]|uniref:hypothetical protein n=1 Tax=Mycobacterium sp. TaxID=1785 RepID=UPI002639D6E0|nr:hypothetical protein [Mycobacterium sp.]